MNRASPAAPWMWALFWATALVLATFFLSEWLNTRDNPNRQFASRVDQGRAEVSLQRNRAGHYVATGQINGRDVQFLIDTGATYVGIPGSVAADLGLRSSVASTTLTAGGKVATYLVTLAEVRLGDIAIQQVRASIIPDMPGNQVLLGMSMLQHLELTQRDGVLQLREP
jgi:aspartyl protease family protein